MSLKQIQGNEQMIGRMKEAAKSREVSHAYILEGDESVDKLRIAREFVKAILCERQQEDGSSCDLCLSCQKIDHENHEDVFFLKTDKNSVKDEAVEEMQRRLFHRPNASDRNIAIIKRADAMTLRAQNRLLKTLEEPAVGTVILLLSENSENLVPTIRSRCILYRFTSSQKELDEEILMAAAQTGELWMSQKPFYRLTKAIEPALADRASALAFLDALELWLRDCLMSQYDSQGVLPQGRWPQTKERLRELARCCGKESIYAAVKAAEEARRKLQHNINTGYALKGMLLK